MDSKIVQVALNGLENILRFGEAESKNTGGSNPYAVIIEEVFGLDKIEFLQVCWEIFVAFHQAISFISEP